VLEENAAALDAAGRQLSHKAQASGWLEPVSGGP